MRDDGSLGRFDAAGERSFSARDAVVAGLVTSVLLVLFAGGSVKRAAAEMGDGVAKSLVQAVGKPTSEVADALPFASVGHHLTSWLSPEEDLGSTGGGFASLSVTTAGGVPPVTPDAFDPGAV